MEIGKIEGYIYIVHQPGVCGGRPTIINTRIEPWHLTTSGSVENVMSGWRYLTREQVEEAFSFYNDNEDYRQLIAKERKEESN
jgi:uncharacterized protein (DUF433 family)